MSNVAPHSRSQFDPSTHVLHHALIFGHPVAHLVIKWTKTLQDNKSHHVVQLPEIDNLYLCPVKAFKALLSTRQLPRTTPLFATNTPPPFHQIIDTQVRQALKTVLTSRKINHVGHGFHTFRRSGATLAYDHSIPLQNISWPMAQLSYMDLPAKCLSSPIYYSNYFLLHRTQTSVAGLGVLKFPLYPF